MLISQLIETEYIQKYYSNSNKAKSLNLYL